MKVIEVKKVEILATVVLTETEMRGLVKLIDPTSENDRVENNYLTREESQAMEKIYEELSDVIGAD